MIRTAGALGAARAVVVEMAVEVAVGAGREATEAVAGLEGMGGGVGGASTERGPMAPFDVSDQHTQAFLRSVAAGVSVAAGALGGNRWVGQALMNPSNPHAARCQTRGGPWRSSLILIYTNRKLRSPKGDNWEKRERRDAVTREKTLVGNCDTQLCILPPVNCVPIRAALKSGGRSACGGDPRWARAGDARALRASCAQGRRRSG